MGGVLAVEDGAVDDVVVVNVELGVVIEDGVLLIKFLAEYG